MKSLGIFLFICITFSNSFKNFFSIKSNKDYFNDISNYNSNKNDREYNIEKKDYTEQINDFISQINYSNKFILPNSDTIEKVDPDLLMRISYGTNPSIKGTFRFNNEHMEFIPFKSESFLITKLENSKISKYEFFKAVLSANPRHLSENFKNDLELSLVFKYDTRYFNMDNNKLKQKKYLIISLPFSIKEENSNDKNQNKYSNNIYSNKYIYDIFSKNHSVLKKHSHKYVKTPHLIRRSLKDKRLNPEYKKFNNFSDFEELKRFKNYNISDDLLRDFTFDLSETISKSMQNMEKINIKKTSKYEKNPSDFIFVESNDNWNNFYLNKNDPEGQKNEEELSQNKTGIFQFKEILESFKKNLIYYEEPNLEDFQYILTKNEIKYPNIDSFNIGSLVNIKISNFVFTENNLISIDFYNYFKKYIEITKSQSINNKNEVDDSKNSFLKRFIKFADEKLLEELNNFINTFKYVKINKTESDENNLGAIKLNKVYCTKNFNFEERNNINSNFKDYEEFNIKKPKLFDSENIGFSLKYFEKYMIFHHPREYGKFIGMKIFIKNHIIHLIITNPKLADLKDDIEINRFFEKIYLKFFTKSSDINEYLDLDTESNNNYLTNKPLIKFINNQSHNQFSHDNIKMKEQYKDDLEKIENTLDNIINSVYNEYNRGYKNTLYNMIHKNLTFNDTVMIKNESSVNYLNQIENLKFNKKEKKLIKDFKTDEIEEEIIQNKNEYNKNLEKLENSKDSNDKSNQENQENLSNQKNSNENNKPEEKIKIDEENTSVQNNKTISDRTKPFLKHQKIKFLNGTFIIIDTMMLPSDNIKLSIAKKKFQEIIDKQ